jgi:hypothetical protein
VERCQAGACLDDPRGLGARADSSGILATRQTAPQAWQRRRVGRRKSAGRSPRARRAAVAAGRGAIARRGRMRCLGPVPRWAVGAPHDVEVNREFVATARAVRLSCHVRHSNSPLGLSGAFAPVKSHLLPARKLPSGTVFGVWTDASPSSVSPLRRPLHLVVRLPEIAASPDLTFVVPRPLVSTFSRLRTSAQHDAGTVPAALKHVCRVQEATCSVSTSPAEQVDLLQLGPLLVPRRGPTGGRTLSIERERESVESVCVRRRLRGQSVRSVRILCPPHRLFSRRPALPPGITVNCSR